MFSDAWRRLWLSHAYDTISFTIYDIPGRTPVGIYRAAPARLFRFAFAKQLTAQRPRSWVSQFGPSRVELADGLSAFGARWLVSGILVGYN